MELFIQPFHFWRPRPKNEPRGADYPLLEGSRYI